MIKQTFKFALRSFRKSVLVSLLNIFGLSLGLSVIFLVGLYVYQENSYENDLTDKGQIFQLSSIVPGVGSMAYNSPNFTFLKDEMPEIKAVTAFSSASSIAIGVEGKEVLSLRSIRADNEFLNVFDYEVLSSLNKQFFNQKNFVVITDKAALKVFGKLDVVGEVFDYKKEQFQIAAVIKSPDFKTQLDFELLMPSKDQEFRPDVWGASHFVYARLNDGNTQQQLNDRLSDISFKYVLPTVTGLKRAQMNSKAWRESPEYKGATAESLHELRTSSTTKFNLMPQVDLGQLKTMIIIGLAALIVSIVNFINLSTAKASVRFKESGLKLILGSSRIQLISQFLLEAFLIVATAALLALGIAELIVQLGVGFVDSFIDYSILQSSDWIKGIVCFVLGLSVISGIYPALYLSSGKTMSLLRKGKENNSIGLLSSKWVRKTTTIAQFVCSISLIVAVLVMFQQLNFLKERDLGYEDEDLFATSTLNPLSNPIDKTDKLEAFRNELLRLSEIEGVGFASRMPLDGVQYIPVPLKVSDSTEVDFVFMNADEGFLDLMQFKLVSGAFFTQSTIGEGSGAAIKQAVINEAAAAAMGWDNPVGKVLNDSYQVVGVVDDFFFSDLRKRVDPIVITYAKPNINANLIIRSKNMSSTMQKVEEIWSGLAWSGWGINNPKWHVLESKYQQLIEAEREGFSLILSFAIVAIVISCIGLLGFAIFTMEQRIHEFGVRKVLGASLVNIIALFSRDIGKLILLAFIITVPISIYLMRNWLDGFANRINLSVGVFALSMLIILVIALGTTLLQIIRAARLNPVETLRNE